MRSISTERLFPLGDYKNIKFFESTEIPEGNEELANAVRYYQMLSVDMAYQRYVQLYRNMTGLGDEERTAYLLAEQAEALDKIKNLLGNQ